jgi:hypothetical protein
VLRKERAACSFFKSPDLLIGGVDSVDAHHADEQRDEAE